MTSKAQTLLQTTELQPVTSCGLTYSCAIVCCHFCTCKATMETQHLLIDVNASAACECVLSCYILTQHNYHLLHHEQACFSHWYVQWHEMLFFRYCKVCDDGTRCGL